VYFELPVQLKWSDQSERFIFNLIYPLAHDMEMFVSFFFQYLLINILFLYSTLVH